MCAFAPLNLCFYFSICKHIHARPSACSLLKYCCSCCTPARRSGRKCGSCVRPAPVPRPATFRANTCRSWRQPGPIFRQSECLCICLCVCVERRTADGPPVVQGDREVESISNCQKSASCMHRTKSGNLKVNNPPLITLSGGPDTNENRDSARGSD